MERSCSWYMQGIEFVRFLFHHPDTAHIGYCRRLTPITRVDIRRDWENDFSSILSCSLWRCTGWGWPRLALASIPVKHTGLAILNPVRSSNMDYESCFLSPHSRRSQRREISFSWSFGSHPRCQEWAQIPPWGAQSCPAMTGGQSFKARILANIGIAIHGPRHNEIWDELSDLASKATIIPSAVRDEPLIHSSY
jgi:hypothetical protein